MYQAKEIQEKDNKELFSMKKDLASKFDADKYIENEIAKRKNRGW